jgi:hypothetical protein
MAQIKIFTHYSGDKVFLAVQMLKRHHRLVIRRDEDDYLALVRPVDHLPGQIQFVVPDPRWPGAEDGKLTRINPEDALALDLRMATVAEARELADALLDALVP